MSSINITNGRSITASASITNSQYVTDGSTATAQYASIGAGLQYVQIDLGAIYDLDKIKVWHYWSDGRTYYSSRTQISENGTDWTDIYNSDNDGTYAETSAGMTHTFTRTSARYIRDSLNGSSLNTGNHWVEIQGFGFLSDATGGTITYSGTKTIHKFTSSGNFIIPTFIGTKTAEYLVVAGGGGGGKGNGFGYEAGGGGGGGLLSGSGHTVTAKTYSITVGGGGATQVNGSNSVFDIFTSIGGGHGGTYSAGAVGGSGGGGTHNQQAGGAGTAGQGNAGARPSTPSRGGGGGGAGAGGGGTGAGGAGASNSITGSAVYYAGGGGAYNAITGGTGGGGTSTTTINAAVGSGTNGLGGGGAGAYSTGATNGGAGGSGVVIISYTTAQFTNITATENYLSLPRRTRFPGLITEVA